MKSHEIGTVKVQRGRAKKSAACMCTRDYENIVCE